MIELQISKEIISEASRHSEERIQYEYNRFDI